MKEVIAVVDIGKTNKKILFFDNQFEMVSSVSTRFDEIQDEDGFACDDIVAIEKWLKEEIKKVQALGKYKLKAINFSTHGASLIYLNKGVILLPSLFKYIKLAPCVEKFIAFNLYLPRA